MEALAASLCVPLLALLALPAASAAAGRARLEAPESLALAAGIALAWCMAGGMALGALGQLRPAGVWLWLALGALASFAVGRRARFDLRAWARGWRGWSSTLLLAPPALGLLLLASVPAWYRDSLVYHLALPRHFARHGGYAWPDDNIFAALPLGWESALALLYALDPGAHPVPPFEPRLVGAWTAVGAALATLALARAAGARPVLASAAAALGMLLPTAVEFGASAYVESALLLLSSLALWWTLRARSGDTAWWGSAVLAGLVCWIKYPALALVVCLALVVPLLATLQREDRPSPASWLRCAALWSALCAATASPFFLRNLLWRGNPFFPTAYGLFGGRGWDEWRAWAYGVTLSNYGHGREPLDWLLLPWRLFSQRSFEHGFEGSLGPLVAVGLPLGAWLALRGGASPSRRQAALLLLAWVAWMSLFWALTVQQARFYLVATPALLALLAAGASQLAATPLAARAIAAALVAAQLAWSAGPVTFLWQRQHTGAWLAGRLEREDLLERMLPESYRPGRELEALVPEDGRVWLVWMREYTYYLRRPYRVDNVFGAWRLEALLDDQPEAQALGDALRADGITHLLVNHRFFLTNDNADLRPGRTDLLRRRFTAAISEGEIVPKREWGPVTLYAVKAPAPVAQLPQPAAQRLGRGWVQAE